MNVRLKRSLLVLATLFVFFALYTPADAQVVVEVGHHHHHRHYRHHHHHHHR